MSLLFSPLRSSRSNRACTLALAAVLAASGLASRADAFCGFYVAKADASLYNEASQVILVRDGDRTVLTMSNDYKGELKEFALVVPVPVILKEGQIHVGEKVIVDRLDAFSAPRLVEYFDEDPCERMRTEEMVVASAPMKMADASSRRHRASALGVTIEAQYTVGEYDILILSAKESSGLETWLVENGYKLPKGASKALQPYIKQGLKFFVAKVNLEEQVKAGFSYLRPLQMAYESPRFMLPIRLGMVNAKGPQDLLVYALTRNGRVEATNYHTVKIPSGMELPPYVKEDFAKFYPAMFETAHQREGENAVFVEYFWDMAWCDPCAADPLTPEELRKAGVFWLDEGGSPGNGGVMPRRGPGGPSEVRITRLHVRYDSSHFPEDLTFRETEDRENFQGRYVLRHPYTGSSSCDEGRAYREQLAKRQETEAQTLAHLTGWDVNDLRKRIGITPAPKPVTGEKSWWDKIFKK